MSTFTIVSWAVITIVSLTAGLLFSHYVWRGKWRIEAWTEDEIKAQLKEKYDPENKTSIYWNAPAANVTFCFGVLAAVYAAFIAWSLIYRHPNPKETLIHTAVWTLGPPFFFFFETFYLFPHFGRKVMTENMRHGQEVARALWVGVAVLLFALMKGRFPELAE